MRKGLTLTLMTVLMAVFCLNAMAEAPTISDLKDIVVGDEASVTAPNLFVYPDALDLDAYVTDPEDDPITWSFLDSSDRYLISGVSGATRADITGTSEDDDPEAGDTDEETITVRDQTLSPIGGSNTDPGAAGIAASAAVTFWASDGDKEASATLIIYTDNDGDDRLSPGGTWTDHQAWSFDATTENGWDDSTFVYGGATMGFDADGMCMEVDAATDQDGWWVGPYGEPNGISFVNNAVYRVRLTMSVNNVDPEQDPLWDFIFENQDPGGDGAYVYGGDYWFLAQTGAANGISNQTGGVFSLVYAPACIAMSSWATAAGDSANDDDNDMRMSWRVIDGGFDGSPTDYGKMCIESIDVDRMDFGSLALSTAAWDATDMAEADWTAVGVVGTNAAFSGGDLTLTPTSATSWDAELINVDPGDTDFTTADLADNYPIAWTADQLYVLEVELQTNAAGEADPVDYINFMIDSASNEMFAESYITSNLSAVAMPIAASASKYYAFMYGHNVSTSSEALHARIRGHMYAACDSSIFGGAGSHDGTNLIVKGMKIFEMDMPD